MKCGVSAAESRWTRLLGLAGVLPFAGAAVMLLLDWYPALALHALLTYGAVILTFVGAVHWGWVLRAQDRDPTLLVASVLPSLVAWGSLLLMLAAAPAALIVQIAAFSLWHGWERGAGHLPSDYLALRLRLTAGVVALQGLSLAALRLA